MLSNPSAASINHLLRGAPWALEKLAAHAGKIVAVKFGPIPLCFAVEPSGELSAARSDREPDVTIDVPPPLFMRAIAQGRGALNDAAITGDSAFAQTLAYLAEHLRWDYEEDLSKVVGDIAAHRAGSTVRDVGAWAKESAASFLRMSKDFWTEERPTIAKSQQVASFIVSVDELRDAVARLEKRIELMTQNTRQR